jgi:hypothetical protein
VKRTDLARQLAAVYFAAQGLATVGWWAALMLVPAWREPFLGTGVSFGMLSAFAPGDLVLLVPTSAAAAFGIARSTSWAWTPALFAAACGMYASAYSVAVPFTVGGGIGGAVIMAPVLLLAPAALLATRHWMKSR